MNASITVIICTFKRSGLLAAALGSVCRQTLPGDQYHVIVVDNGPGAETRAVADEFSHQRPIVYLVEERQGLSHARNAGWRAAVTPYVAYLDDDAVAPENWLAIAREIIADRHPAIFGGPYFPEYDAPRPVWFKDAYASHKIGDDARSLHGPGLTGGNLFVRRELLEALGGFDPQLGMCGGSLGYGEETALLKRVGERMPGRLIWYEPRLFVRHLCKSEKMTLRWRVQSAFVAGRHSARILVRPRRLRIVLLDLVKECSRVGRALVRIPGRNRDRFPYWQNFIFEIILPHINMLGALWGELVDGDRQPAG